MSSVSDRLDYINETKNEIKEAIEFLGIDMTDVEFDEYAEKIKLYKDDTIISQVDLNEFILRCIDISGESILS